ncbi:hypothetical protein [Streptomyces dysideae]|uniref:Integral membrane protein n=1 Tax=Streptomyces dysideae TaxID=909626 RepID=A0A101UYI4_9ACTN|nr:hypothetical protein [Streptomyces dysideae]KUO19136.1 hypothetical protein AQJ91_21570 [Streptomyces dysideae]
MNRDLRHDLYTAAAAALLVAVAAVVGTVIQDRHGTLRVNWPPLLANWDPHVGPGTPAALAVAVAVIAYGPSLAARLPWRALLLGVWVTGMAWTWSLALIDGWHRGIAVQLTTPHEYLRVIDRFQDIPATLRDFTAHILLETPDNWPAHIAGHPPGATLTFVFLDRIGLGGGGWAGAFVITTGTTAAVAVLIAVRLLTDEKLARRAAPFLVLAPAAVWVGTSADGYFAAVVAWAVAFLALAVTGHRPAWTGLASGLLFGWTMYLSYGLSLFVVIAAAVLLLGTHRVRPLPCLLAGFLVAPVVFTAIGFDWWEAYRLLVTRYYQGAGGVRPYGYWVWANLACTVVVVGLATVAGLRRAGGALVRRDDGTSGSRWSRLVRGDGPPAPRLSVLVCAALLALLVADLSGMSKAETERIWLPFAMWLLPACAFLSGVRGWLAAQAVAALLVNHLLLTGW